MSDILVKALGYNSHARIYAVTTTDALNIIGDRLSYFPSALDALGRVMSMGAIMGGTLKGEETATLRIDGDGQIGRIVVDANAHGAIRGYAENPHCHFEYNDFRLNAKATIGSKGMITIIKDLKLKEPFIGYTPIINGEIAEDFAYYYLVSEQIPTAISLGVLVDTEGRAVTSGGFMIQLLPNTPEEVAIEIENKIKSLPTISEMLSSGFTPEDIINNLAKDAKILSTTPVEFKCNCSKEKFAKGILSLGSKEIKEIIDEDKEANTTCHFCGNDYHFDFDELTSLYEEAVSKGK
jgi:molecular chaperone Hsp33